MTIFFKKISSGNYTLHLFGFIILMIFGICDIVNYLCIVLECESKVYSITWPSVFLIAEVFAFPVSTLLKLAIVIHSNIKNHVWARTITYVEISNTCYILFLFVLIEVNCLSVINAIRLLKCKLAKYSSQFSLNTTPYISLCNVECRDIHFLAWIILTTFMNEVSLFDIRHIPSASLMQNNDVNLRLTVVKDEF
jgi:hypothetical protein